MKYDNIVNIEYLHKDQKKTDPRFYISYRDLEGKRITVKDHRLFPSYFYIREEEDFLVDNLPKEIQDNIIGRKRGFISVFGDRLLKLSFGKMSKFQFREARDNFTKTFEDDVLYQYRYIIDNNVKYTTNQRVVYFDIETLLSLDIENTPQPIISICAYDNFTKKYFWFFYHPKTELKKEDRKWVDGDGREHKLHTYWYPTEEQMLSEFMKFVRVINPDVISAWNSDWFDIPYLINRIRKIGLNQNDLSTLRKAYTIVSENKDQTRSKIYGMSIVDLKKVYEKLTYDNKPDGYSLSTVAQHTLKDDKIEQEGIRVLWENPDKWEKLLEYNVKDVELCVRIDEKNNLMNYFLTVQQIIPIPAEDIMMNSRVVDMFFLQRYHNKKVFPSKRRRQKEGFMAAFAGKLTKMYRKENEVMFDRMVRTREDPILEGEDSDGKFLWYGKSPQARVFKNVVVIDFSSMYPGIYMTFNISPDTKVANGQIKAEDVEFTTDFVGLIPGSLQELLNERKKLEADRDAIEDSSSTEYFALQNKQGALKAIINSIFGIMGFENFRLYDVDVAKSVTYFGRVFIALLDEMVREAGFSTIYSDTDSVFIQLPEDLDEEESIKLAKDIEAKMNKRIEEVAYELGAKKNYMKVDAEKIFKGLLFRGVKKQYFGRLYYKKGHRTNEIFSRGMDIVRRDTPRVIKPVMSDIIERILNKEDMKEVRDMLDKITKELKSSSAFEIGSTKRLSKNFRPPGTPDEKVNVDMYKSNNKDNIRACLFSNYFLGTSWQKADYPKIVYVKMTPSAEIKSQIDDFRKEWGLGDIEEIAIDEDTKIPDWIEVDYKRMFEKFIYMRLQLFENVEGVQVRRLYSKDRFLQDFIDINTPEAKPFTAEDYDDEEDRRRSDAFEREISGEEYDDYYDEDENDDEVTITIRAKKARVEIDE